jgi:hypothetical protein
MTSKDRKEIVAHGVTRREQPRLDARHFCQRRHPESVDFFRLQGPGPSELPETGKHAIEAAEDQHRTLHPGRLPSGGGLQTTEDLVEAIPQVRDHVVAVQAHPMASVYGRRCAAHQHGSGNQVLQVALGGEQALPIRQVTNVGHDAIVPRPRDIEVAEFPEIRQYHCRM